MDRLLVALETGIAQGAMIALVAIGYTLVYGVLRLINFAHGEVFMVGAYAGLFALVAVLGAAPIVAYAASTAFAVLVASALGVAIERVAYRPLRRPDHARRLARVAPLVTAIGASVFLQNLAQLLFGARFRPYPRVFDRTRPVVIVAAFVAMIALEVVVKRTWLGKAMRALADDEEAARLVGVRPSRVTAATFALGSALAAVGAVLFCLDQSQVYPTMGFAIGVRGFVAAVLGGIGSVTGAMLGGLLLGLVGEVVKLTDWSGGADVLVFVVLVAVLLVRPEGLLGRLAARR